MKLEDEIADLVIRLGKECLPDGPSLAFAESCTGGLLCAALVAQPQASGALERGFIVYSTDAKCDLLDLDRAQVEACEGVSREVAANMANAALGRSRADIALAITGFAGPQEKDEEVGLVHLALARRDSAIVHQTCHFGDLGRDTVCKRSVIAALELLVANLPQDRTGR